MKRVQKIIIFLLVAVLTVSLLQVQEPLAANTSNSKITLKIKKKLYK